MTFLEKPAFYGTAMQAFWLQMRPLAFVILAMLFGTVMTVMAKLLESSQEDTPGMGPVQVLFARFLITSVISHVYMMASNVQHAPFGLKDIRWYLVGRGIAGFVGVYGLFYSVKYLPTTVATVFTFLTPIVGPWLSFFYVGEPFPRHEQLAGALSLVGVFIVALPSGDSGTHSVATTSNFPATNSTVPPPTNSTCALHPGPSCLPTTTPDGRVIAITTALFGVLGASVAYTLIRKIGNRAHSLIIVNYLSDMATLFSLLILVIGKGIQLPSSLLQGFYLVALGLCGFASQFFLTMGIQEDRTSAAAIMIYTQLLFAMGFDWALWGTSPGWSGWVGCILIFGSAAFVAVKKTKAKVPVVELGKCPDEEEQGLMSDMVASVSEGGSALRATGSE